MTRPSQQMKNEPATLIRAVAANQSDQPANAAVANPPPRPPARPPVTAAEADHIDMRDLRIHQLHALLTSWTGHGFEAFDGWAEDVKHGLLSIASSMADDLLKAHTALEIDRRST